MSATAERLEMTFPYCEGWDPRLRRTIGRLPADTGRMRDQAGEQYAVVLEALGRPRMIIEVAWRHHYCAAWLLDDTLRRTTKLEFGDWSTFAGFLSGFWFSREGE